MFCNVNTYKCTTSTFISSGDFQVVLLISAIYETEGTDIKIRQNCSVTTKNQTGQGLPWTVLKYLRTRLVKPWCVVLWSCTQFILQSKSLQLSSGDIWSPAVTHWSDFFPSNTKWFWMNKILTTSLQFLSRYVMSALEVIPLKIVVPQTIKCNGREKNCIFFITP